MYSHRIRRPVDRAAAGLSWSRPLPVVRPATGVDIDHTHQAPARSVIVPDATRAAWDGETLVVQFREVGLLPGTVTTVAVTGEAASDATAELDDRAGYTMHAEAVVTAEARCEADPSGAIDHTFALHLANRIALARPSSRSPMAVDQSFFATVRDLDTGAVTYLSGTAQPETTTAASSGRSHETTDVSEGPVEPATTGCANT